MAILRRRGWLPAIFLRSGVHFPAGTTGCKCATFASRRWIYSRADNPLAGSMIMRCQAEKEHLLVFFRLRLVLSIRSQVWFNQAAEKCRWAA